MTVANPQKCAEKRVTNADDPSPGARGVPARRTAGVCFHLEETVDFNLLFEIADKARGRETFNAKDATFVRKVVPRELGSLHRRGLPTSVRHPAGFKVTGASVRTFVRSALLLAGQRVLGRRYGESEFYTNVERDLAFGIMRSHFHHGYPKGTYCCSQCTLAVYPVLEANAIRYFDSAELAKAVNQVIARKQWRFSTRPPQPMLDWALRLKQ
jgi:hypothetical protein